MKAFAVVQGPADSCASLGSESAGRSSVAGGLALRRCVLAEFKPDLVLSDIAMPGRDGYAVLSAVRALESIFGRHVPVAAVTAYAHAEDRERAIAAGFDDYVAKPVDPAALASAVAALAAVDNPSGPKA